jgi:predicted alpha/beta superfamily hydrolase
MGGEPFSDLYLKHLVEEVKPFVDNTYASLPEKQSTIVMGSSMGGLISLYAISQYPHVFGGAGCVSTHWSAGELALVEEMAKRLPDSAGHKLYFDYGTRGVDAPYEPLQLKFDEHLRTKGFTEGKNWVTRKFEGADHNEAAWQARVDIPLSFLFS